MHTHAFCRPALRLAQVLVGAGAAVAGLLGPLLPTWALDSFALDSLATDTSIDPGLGDSPPLLDTLLVVVITYFTVMLLYLWLSSFMVREEHGQGPHTLAKLTARGPDTLTVLYMSRPVDRQQSNSTGSRLVQF